MQHQQIDPCVQLQQQLQLCSAMASSAGGSSAAMARRIYLSLYNWVAFYGWAQVLYGTVSALLLESGGHEAVYAAVERPLLFAQTLAVVEILHSVLGFVKSPVSATFAQIFGRMYVTWAVLWCFCEAQSHILVTSLMLSWSITEVIRYPFFGMRETFGFAPSWLLWLRYNNFLVLYPIGMLSKVGLIFVAMPSMKTSGRCYLHCATTAILPLYVPGFPYLYRYMIARRKKVLSAAKIA
uniref:Uncharacterized protein n=1 Tax=Avena sativa TaxID=4498 RepID=A0ACD5VMB5_AVESA